MIYRFTIPIDNYYEAGVFDKHIYFEAETCPTYEEVKRALRFKHEEELKLSKEHPEYGPFIFEFKQCLETLELTDSNNFPYATRRVVMTNCFVTHPRWGRQSIVVSVIEPIKECEYIEKT